MKTYIFFAALIATAAPFPSKLRSISPPGSPAALAPSIQVNLDAAVSAVGQENTAVNQQISELASGDAVVPASIESSSLILAELGQHEEIEQIAHVDQETGEADTFQNVQVIQGAVAEEAVGTHITAANFAAAQYSGESIATGSGEIAEFDSTVVNQPLAPSSPTQGNIAPLPPTPTYY